ncbi:MAG: arylamine N-acetyltransferase [Chloroflexi bacterium]|nr:arylamine N-acetyltransferase [Chloroflexota bacterium]
MFEASAYLNRINYHGSTEPTIETLRGIHRAHLLAVPFENLDIRLNRQIVLKEAALFEKIVVNRRGGFCYELNGLFASLLRQMGFDVTIFSSNVLHGGIPAEIDHLTLLIQLDERWIADVGFGDSSRLPLRLVEEEQQFSVDSTYRFVRSNNRWLLQRLIETEEWYDEYSFDVNLTPLVLSDFEEANRYYQTASASYFVQGRICSRATEEGRISLTDNALIVTRNGQREETPIEDEQAFVRALNQHFGVRMEEKR